MRKTERVLLDAKKVFDLAEKNGMLKADLSAACGIPDTWVHGAIRTPIIRPKAELMADRLGVSLDEIMARDETVRAIAEMTKAIKHMEQLLFIDLSDVCGAVLELQTLPVQMRKDILDAMKDFLEAIESVWGLEE